MVSVLDSVHHTHLFVAITIFIFSISPAYILFLNSNIYLNGLISQYRNLCLAFFTVHQIMATKFNIFH